jgi:hypothetical protein
MKYLLLSVVLVGICGVAEAQTSGPGGPGIARGQSLPFYPGIAYGPPVAGTAGIALGPAIPYAPPIALGPPPIQPFTMPPPYQAPRYGAYWKSPAPSYRDEVPYGSVDAARPSYGGSSYTSEEMPDPFEEELLRLEEE